MTLAKWDSLKLLINNFLFSLFLSLILSHSTSLCYSWADSQWSVSSIHWEAITSPGREAIFISSHSILHHLVLKAALTAYRDHQAEQYFTSESYYRLTKEHHPKTEGSWQVVSDDMIILSISCSRIILKNYFYSHCLRLWCIYCCVLPWVFSSSLFLVMAYIWIFKETIRGHVFICYGYTIKCPLRWEF